MLKRLHLRNFTVFADAEFEFGEGLNVLVGANGTGKTHMLKAGYAVERNLLYRVEENKADIINQRKIFERPGMWFLKNMLLNIFRPVPASVSEIIRRGGDSREATLESSIVYSAGQIDTSLSISLDHSTSRGLKWPTELEENARKYYPIFIPAKEVLTMGWLLALYDRREIPIDETYPDLLRILSGPPLRQPEPAHIVKKLQELIGGKVEEEGGNFYLTTENQPRLEMNLVAEGMRKFATLYKLLANGTLTPETTLFWDEPEANLNPALLGEMAVVLTDLAEAGFQIILATHSLFLLKELHILSQNGKPVRYFGLSAQPGEAVAVATTDNLELLPNIVALDAELEQADRFQRVLDQEDANRS